MKRAAVVQTKPALHQQTGTRVAGLHRTGFQDSNSLNLNEYDMGNKEMSPLMAKLLKLGLFSVVLLTVALTLSAAPPEEPKWITCEFTVLASFLGTEATPNPAALIIESSGNGRPDSYFWAIGLDPKMSQLRPGHYSGRFLPLKPGEIGVHLLVGAYEVGTEKPAYLEYIAYLLTDCSGDTPGHPIGCIHSELLKSLSQKPASSSRGKNST